jgi:hypothetical protein
MRNPRVFGITRYFPEREQSAKPQNEQRKDKNAYDFTELPSNQVQLPLAAIVESDHSRHHDLHLWLKDGEIARWELPRHPERVHRTVPFRLSSEMLAGSSQEGGNDSEPLFPKEEKPRGQRLCCSTRIRKRIYAVGVSSGGGLFQCEKEKRCSR